MRIVIAVLVGLLLAGGVSMGAAQMVGATSDDAVTDPLYNYGTR
ncbi:MAG TPA: hypothetical protein VHJ17_11510 [Thermomonospora sp.]|nr:hypothetical protein [Thermomonospora sp.]